MILDNKSTLIRGGDENSAEGCESINSWLLTLRSFGVTTIIIHHAGKRKLDGSLAQRGSSRIEDVVDGIIQLDAAGKPEGGVVPVRWTYEKCRSFTPDDLSFGLNVCYDDAQGLGWLELGDVGGSPPDWLAAARALQAQGKSYQEIADSVGAPKTSIFRWLKKRTLSELAT